MTFSPTSLELQVMRVLEQNPWYPPRALAELAGLTDIGRVRSTLAELRRFCLVQTNTRIGGGGAARYCLTAGGQAVLTDATRRRALDAVAAELTAA